MIELSQIKQQDAAPIIAETPIIVKNWLIPENCIGLNVNNKYEIMNKLQEDPLSITYLVKQSLQNPALGRFFQLQLYKPTILSGDWLKEGIFEQIKNNLSLNSRLILSCFEYGEWNNIPFTIHDFFDWKTLDTVINERQNKSISKKFAVSCVIEVLKCLESLHSYPCEFKYSSNFIHANLSPKKILISQDTGMVLLADTGIIGLYTRASTTNAEFLPTEIAYLSPEQINLEPISTASDIFTVGLILLDLLTPLYREKINSLNHEQIFEFLNEHLIKELPTFNLNEEIIKVLKKALNPNVTARYQSPALFIADLNAYLRKQYWVFDTKENIKTVFYQQEDSDKTNTPRFEFNRTLELSSPKELVNSVPLEELSAEIEKVTQVQTEIIAPVQNEKINLSSNKTAPLHTFEAPLIPLKREIVTENKKNHKKLIGIIAAAAVILFVVISSIKGHQAKKTEQLATIQPTPVVMSEPTPIITKAVPTPIIVNKPVVKQLKKTAHKQVAVAVKKTPTKTTEPMQIKGATANVSINAVPFATIDIPAANISGEMTPVSNIKIPVAKFVAITVRHGKCSFSKIVDSQQQSSFNLRFNMYACKEY